MLIGLGRRRIFCDGGDSRADQGLNIDASKYEVEIEPFMTVFSVGLRNPTTSETRHLMTAYVPVNADGSTTKIYTGTKDYFILSRLQ